MTTQQKTAAIRQIIANNQDNLTATNAAQIPAGLDALVIQARDEAFVEDLRKVFAMPATSAGMNFETIAADKPGAARTRSGKPRA